MSYVSIFILVFVVVGPRWLVGSEIDCPTVTQLLSSCSAFITYGTPDPLPGSACCDAMVGLSYLGDSSENRRSVCKCIMGLIDAYDPNSAAIASLPGFCGVTLGFIVEPNVDCSMVS